VLLSCLCSDERVTLEQLMCCLISFRICNSKRIGAAQLIALHPFHICPDQNPPK
jgi:hypothetical protein